MSEDYPTDTPRTNAFEETCGDYEKPYVYTQRLAAFTRGLERELAETKKEISQLKRKYNMASQVDA